MAEQATLLKGETRRQHLSAAYGLASGLIGGEKTLADLSADLKDRGRRCLDDRLKRMSSQWTELVADKNITRLEALVDGLGVDDKGAKLPFEAFKAKIEDDVAGLVVTAHPTFSLSTDAWAYAEKYLCALAKGGDTAKATENMPLDSVQPQTSPTLYEELEYARVAVSNIRRSIRRFYEVVFNRAAELYPDDYKSLRPRVATVASWVGFDLDGRTDIDWSLGLIFRYRSALAGLDECLSLCRSLPYGGDGADAAARVTAGFQELRKCFEAGEQALQAHKESPTGLGKLNQLAVENMSRKEKAKDAINSAFEDLLKTDLPHDMWRAAATLYTEWRTVGMGLSHIHFRLNAQQLHNAIGHELQMTNAPDQSAVRRHFLAAVTEKLDSVEEQSIHYGTLAAEQTTARRVFMLAAQFMKHFDAATRIRMLVAESDTPFTLLTALYYAKLFGVDDHVEISPLFETAIGLERGDRVIAEVLDNPHFLAYIKQQGRFCIQLGFSDSGRYIGQPAASLAIERFKLRVVRLWKQRGLGDVQLLFFDTHGESIGRGAFPESLKKRFLYTHPPRVRQWLSELKQAEKHEVSFQGGEGFLWFLAEETALATLTDFLEVRFDSYSADDDKLYEERGWALDFFLTLVEYQNTLTDNKGYVRLIDSIGRSLLFPTGSRSLRRQSGGAVHQRLERISQIRAIPHNAVLQQLGYLANSCAGLGTAIGLSPDKFNRIRGESNRLQMITNMALNALARSDVGVIEAYAKLLSPGYWLDRCDETDSGKQREQLRRLSGIMEGLFESDTVDACIRDLRRDAGMLTDCLTDDAALTILDEGVDSELFEFHQIRIGLIQYIFMKAMEIPRFSTRFDFSLEELLVEMLHLEVPDTLEQLRKIFPEAPPQSDDDVFGEESTYKSGASSGYGKVHSQIFDEIEKAYDLVLTLSGLIALKAGAFG
ncbi:phosphoenolpyruvate carboxylase [Kordiimonas sp. SCSIO 12603]|uniref:phosphoenolpyruvate carboxylase n=1 Tax=Kordiimonas sp. SCSIO 12603 TaxID=2829596 RepID=UPI0021070F11|nr:phosphoenolpyruvate carboxylase [Kordiimonas sp. SCSIO 12603]UTW59179.1 phosphoenolpyruvate carboxylase [Kordiimonas sp. SCSIO 12603]